MAAFEEPDCDFCVLVPSGCRVRSSSSSSSLPPHTLLLLLFLRSLLTKSPPIRFYGINLNQSVVLQQIHFNGKDEPEWQSLFHIATGNLIITALGFVPGAFIPHIISSPFLSSYTPLLTNLLSRILRHDSHDRVSRKEMDPDPRILIRCLILSVFSPYSRECITEVDSNRVIVAILASRFNELSIPAFVTLFALLQFFFNFGANA
jgi:PHS family inorganic phosphate transporter-like MFS transporter